MTLVRLFGEPIPPSYAGEGLLVERNFLSRTDESLCASDLENISRSPHQPPIWPEDLPLIRELLTDEEYAERLRGMVHVLPNGVLLDYPQTFGEQELKAPNAARTLGARVHCYLLDRC